EAADDGLAEDHLALVLAAVPLAAIDGPAHGGDHRARLVGQQALEVGGLLEEVQAQLDQPGALPGRLLNLRLHHAVPRTGDDHADAVHVGKKHGLTLARPRGFRPIIVPGPAPAHKSVTRRCMRSRRAAKWARTSSAAGAGTPAAPQEPQPPEE